MTAAANCPVCGKPIDEGFHGSCLAKIRDGATEKISIANLGFAAESIESHGTVGALTVLLATGIDFGFQRKGERIYGYARFGGSTSTAFVETEGIFELPTSPEKSANQGRAFREVVAALMTEIEARFSGPPNPEPGKAEGENP
jgi:hypothetical protein